MKSGLSTGTFARVLLALPLVALSCSLSRAQESSAAAQSAAHSQTQLKFDTPQLALQALIKAVDPFDPNALVEIFGGTDFGVGFDGEFEFGAKRSLVVQVEHFFRVRNARRAAGDDRERDFARAVH